VNARVACGGDVPITVETGGFGAARSGRSRGDRDKALDAGASDYIAKPVDVDELVAMMRAWLVAGEPVRSR
jgi:CheY-like chemotaxis protein